MCVLPICLKFEPYGETLLTPSLLCAAPSALSGQKGGEVVAAARRPTEGGREVSTQAATIARPAARAERRPLAGAWLLSAGMLASGVLTYAFHVVAARTLGPAAYGQIAVLWAAMFIASIMIFRPL